MFYHSFLYVHLVISFCIIQPIRIYNCNNHFKRCNGLNVNYITKPFGQTSSKRVNLVERLVDISELHSDNEDQRPVSIMQKANEIN